MGPSYDNSFGNNMQQSSVMSMGTGDIVLAPENGGKSKKGLVILLIVLVVALVAVGVGFLVWSQGGGEGDGGQGVSGSNISDAANDYASYLLYGDVSHNISQDEFEPYDIYAIDEAFESGDSSFFEQLMGYWDNYREEVYKNDDYSSNLFLVWDIEVQAQLMDFVMEYSKVPGLSEREVFSLLSGEWKDDPYGVVDERYSELVKVDYEAGRDYAEAEKKRLKALIDLYNYYLDAGCSDGQELIDECILQSNPSEELLTSYEKSKDDENLMNGSDALRLLKENAYRIVLDTEEVGIDGQ